MWNRLLASTFIGVILLLELSMASKQSHSRSSTGTAGSILSARVSSLALDEDVAPRRPDPSTRDEGLEYSASSEAPRKSTTIHREDKHLNKESKQQSLKRVPGAVVHHDRHILQSDEGGGDSETGNIVGYCVAACAVGGFLLSAIKYVYEVIPEREREMNKKKARIEPEPLPDGAANQLTSVAPGSSSAVVL